MLTELEQRDLFIKNSSNTHFEVYCEVPVFNRSVDLVKLNPQDQTITAIEFKKFDWVRAINQTQKVSISFDFLEICIREPKNLSSKNRVIEKCKSIGLGLCFYNESDNSFFYELEPVKVKQIWEIQKRNVLEYIRKVKNNEIKDIETVTIQHRE